MAKLSKDIAITFRDFHNVTAKAGAPLRAIKGGDRVYYALSPSQVETDSPRDSRSMWAHDTKHYYIYVPDDAVSLDD
jgi:hypothetical protein